MIPDDPVAGGPLEARSRHRHGQGTAGPRAQTLARVQAVPLEVGQVGDEGDGPGERAEGGQGHSHAEYGIRFEEVLGEDQRGRDHQEVLGPLVGPERDEERSGQGHRAPFRGAPVARADLGRSARPRLVAIRTCSC
mgnify:CR=1 FL=1